MPVERPQYPANLIVDGRPCLVVGGGAVARRKVEGLIAAGAVVTVVAPELEPDLAALAAAGAISALRRPYAPGEAAGYRLVVAATDDPAVNRRVFEDGDAAGVWVNAADDPESCSFTLPSVVRRGPIMVTVATGGHSPALATWLRRHVEAELGEEYLVLLTLLSEERAAIKAAGRSTEGLDWLSALDSNMLDLIRAGQVGKARERLQACLSSS
ncbi:MAG TPA: bifunctional precorrin-2 dehydrogenase/sirohydrochlorin ferrochelatase [Acidimicrobiales bacterium]